MAITINQTHGDGSPSYKVTYEPEVTWNINTGGRTNPSLTIDKATLKIKCTAADGNFNADPYVKCTELSRSFPTGLGSMTKLDPNPIGKTKCWSTNHSASTSIAAWGETLQDGVYFKDAWSSFTPSVVVKTDFWREKIGIQFGGTSHNSASNSGSLHVPALARFLQTGSGSKFNSTGTLTINNLWMYTIQSGTYKGVPGRKGNCTCSFNFSVPITVNSAGTLYVVWVGEYGAAKGDQKQITKTISGKTSGNVTVSGSDFFKYGVYRVGLAFKPEGQSQYFSMANVSYYVNNSKNTGIAGAMVFYGPGTNPQGPDNSNPSYSVTNTTATQISTNQTKSVSVRVTLNDNGVSRYYLSSLVYTAKLYWNDGTLIGTYTFNDSNPNSEGHSTDFSTTVQVRPGKRQQEEYVYWVVDGVSKDTSGKLRSGSTKTTGKVNLFWAYNEPAKIAFNSARISSSSGPTFSNNRAQLYYGGTTLNFALQATINAWGDRPGTRTYEFCLNHGGSAVKWYGRVTTSDTGTKSHTYSYTVPDNWVNTSADFSVYKRIDGGEYLASGDPKNPARGTNHDSGGTISFYETIGGVSGMIDIRPSILMLTIPSSITGQGIFDKQSSQRVRYYVEVFDRDTNQVINQYPLGNTTGDITKQVTIDLSSSDFTVPNPHLYELRLKADVTELLGNVHTYTFYTTTRQAFMPPQYILTESTDELLPSVSDTSLLIRQKATNTYSFKVDYDLVLSSSVLSIEYYLASSPNTKRVKTVNIIPQNYAGGVFFGSYTLPNPTTLDPSDPLYDPEGFALGSKVTAWISSTWNLPGSTSVYNNSSSSVHYNVTPTRFIYFLTRNVEEEKWLNTLHSVTPTRADKKSKKIFVETDIS